MPRRQDIADPLAGDLDQILQAIHERPRAAKDGLEHARHDRQKN